MSPCLCSAQDGTQKSQKVFVNIPTEVGATEAEEIGRYPLWNASSAVCLAILPFEEMFYCKGFSRDWFVTKCYTLLRGTEYFCSVAHASIRPVSG